MKCSEVLSAGLDYCWYQLRGFWRAFMYRVELRVDDSLDLCVKRAFSFEDSTQIVE
jgi:hypothetical protein